MPNAIFEPLIERDIGRFDAVARTFAKEHSLDELWTTIARFAVLAYAPSQHAKRAVMTCRALHDIREEAHDRWLDFIIECGSYSAESRQPWSEPPFLDPPEVDPAQPATRNELRAAIDAGDRDRAERWLAARGDGAEKDLRAVARGDALMMTDTAAALLPLLGGKGAYALLRIALWEMIAGNEDDDSDASLDQRIATVIAERGSIESVRDLFLLDAKRGSRPGTGFSSIPLRPYRLARDYGQTLIAHAVARRLRADDPHADLEGFLAAVHENLEHGESYAEWSFA